MKNRNFTLAALGICLLMFALGSCITVPPQWAVSGPPPLTPRPLEYEGRASGMAKIPLPDGGYAQVHLDYSPGYSVSVVKAVPKLIMVTRFDQHLAPVWKKDLELNGGRLDVEAIHESDGKLVIPVSSDREGKIDSVIYGCYVLGLSDGTSTFVELDGRSEDEVAFGAPDESAFAGRGLWIEGDEVVHGDQHLILSPTHRYSTTYHYSESSKPLSVIASVYDSKLRRIRRETLQVTIDEGYEFAGLRIDDSAAIIAVTENVKAGTARVTRYKSGAQPVTVQLTLDLKDMHDVVAQPGKDGKLYVAALESEIYAPTKIAIGVVDFSDRSTRHNVTPITESDSKGWSSDGLLEALAISQFHLDLDHDRIVVVADELQGKTLNASMTHGVDPAARGQNPAAATYDPAYIGSKPPTIGGGGVRVLRSYRVLMMGFDLSGKRAWTNGIEQRQEIAEGQGFSLILSEGSLTKRGTFALWHPLVKDRYAEYELADGKKVTPAHSMPRATTR